MLDFLSFLPFPTKYSSPLLFMNLINGTIIHPASLVIAEISDDLAWLVLFYMSFMKLLIGSAKDTSGSHGSQCVPCSHGKEAQTLVFLTTQRKRCLPGQRILGTLALYLLLHQHFEANYHTRVEWGLTFLLCLHVSNLPWSMPLLPGLGVFCLCTFRGICGQAWSWPITTQLPKSENMKLPLLSPSS